MYLNKEDYKILKHSIGDWEYQSAWDNHEPESISIEEIKILNKNLPKELRSIILDLDLEVEESFSTGLGVAKFETRIKKEYELEIDEIIYTDSGQKIRFKKNNIMA
jgi:hypothetical protein